VVNRTDNAIKNHWNSSVKKKLDSYLASGLLAQFPALPHAGHQNQPMLSSSSRMQSSGGDTSSKIRLLLASFSLQVKWPMLSERNFH
jgi:hypothetical protein